MALSGSFSNYPVSGFGLYCTWSATQSFIGNYSDVTLNVYLKYYSISVGPRSDSTVSIEGYGEMYTTPAISESSTSAHTTLLKTYTARIYHNTDGTKNGVFLSASWRFGGTYSGVYVGTITASVSVNLDTIDRSAPSVSFTVSALTAYGFKISAVSSAVSNIWQYSLNNGLTWTTFSTTPGTTASITLNSLTPDTSYSVKVSARKQSNQVYGYSSTTSVKTLGGSVLNSISTLTADDVSVSFTVNATVYNAGYTHTLSIKNGSTTYLTLSGLSWSASTANRIITLNEGERTTLLNAMSSIKSFTGTFSLQTFNGGTQIGNTSTATGTIETTAANSAPILSGFTFSDNNLTTTAITENNQMLVQGYSELLVTPGTATARNGATIVNFSATCSGVTVANATGTPLNLGFINASGTRDIALTITDSRGYTQTITQSVIVIPYSKPGLSSFSLRRTNNIEAEMQLLFEGSFSPINVASFMKNSLLEVQYRYKKTSDTAYDSFVSILSGVAVTDASFSYSNLELCNLDSGFSYDFHLQITDKLSSYDIYFVVAQGTPLIALRKHKVGINTPNPNAALHVVGDAIIEGAVTFNSINGAYDKPYFGTCSTAGNVFPKVVICSGFVLKTGARIAVKFDNSNLVLPLTMNVNNTGAFDIVTYGTSAPEAYIWKPQQTIDFVYDGTYWVMLAGSTATTTYYGITKLNNTVTSTSEVQAATASAVKQAYDRSSFSSITLSTALAIAYGGTGATTAVNARTNLGITIAHLYSGTLTTGSITFNYGNYNFYVIQGKPSNTAARVCLVVPRTAITTSAQAFQFADESNYKVMNLSYSGSTVTMTMGAGNGQVNNVYGMN